MKSTPESATRTVLLVDDERSILSSLSVLLTSYGYKTIQATTLSDAVEQLSKNSIDLIISDLCLGQNSGLELIRKVKELGETTEIIMITAFSSIEGAVEALQLGAYDYLSKPFSNEQLIVKIRKALERKEMSEELTRLRQQVAMSYGFDNIVGISKPMMQLKETARRIAATDITVLITGASGTGKELISRAIHFHSNRRTKNLVTIDCSAIPETLLESELFGHLKGSFTSATSDKTGLFEQANNGTVFLDEVSNMPQSVQVKLLRFLQNSEIRPVGSSESHRVDVRIIAATNRDLREMVASGEFREDLYYRLNVIPLNIPTLSMRQEDIEILTDYFVRRICMEIGHPQMAVEGDAVDRLRKHSWPGNVRELENTLKRAIVLANGQTITARDLTFVSTSSDDPESGNSLTLTMKSSKGGLIDNSQRTLIFKALNDNNWNYTRTASDLGIGRTTLWRKIKKYELSRETKETASATAGEGE